MRVKDDPLEELRETLLFKRLQGLSEEYAQRTISFVTEIAPILATTSRFFPHYTRHDAHHGYCVIRRIEQIILAECFDGSSPCAFGAAEIYLLIAAAYAHDLGMAVLPGEEPDLATRLSLSLDKSGWEVYPTLQDYLRKTHSQRGGDYVARFAEKLRIPINLVAQLDGMMKSHNMSFPDLEKGLSGPFVAQEQVIDVRQLSIILCIADALEFSDTRVVDGVLDLIAHDRSPAAQQSYRENMKHACIGDSLAVDEFGRVVVSGTFEDPQILALAHYTLDQIEQWIREYCDVDRRSQVRRLRVRPEPFQRGLELRGARFERLGVRMRKENVINLISSNAVWQSNLGLPVRELLQNSVEACRYRRFHSTRADCYVPAISVTFSRSQQTITVEDNGCGMSERVVLNHLLTVGNSRATERPYQSDDYAPIARFGIGFWSVFTIADRALVKTLAFEDADDRGSGNGIEFGIELGDLKDYTVFSYMQLTPGTVVTLYLKPGILIDDVFEQTRKELLCSEVEIALALDEDRLMIPTVPPDVSDEGILDAKQSKKSELGIETFGWRGSMGNTDLTLGIAYRVLEDGTATFLDESQTPLLQGRMGIRPPQTAICGFRVGMSFLPFCFDILRVGTYFANYLTPRGIEFSIDRRQLQETAASGQFAAEISQLVHRGYREFLAKTNSRDPRVIFALNWQSRMNGGEVVDSFTHGELADAYSNFPDLLCFKLRKVQSANLFESVQPEYVDLATVAKRTGTIWVIQNSYFPKIGQGRYASFPAESLLSFAYLYAQRELGRVERDGDIFVVEPDRGASMLFDCAPNSTVEFFKALLLPGQSPVDICIQRISLRDVDFTRTAREILCEVQGRWSGAIYPRSFATPNGKPYVFLGRHRVLIEKSSRLMSYLEDLKSRGRFMKVAETIAFLNDDEAGFTPSALMGLV